MRMGTKEELDIIVPVSMDVDWQTNEQIVEDILELYHKHGFTRFVLAAPGKGCRSEGYPSDAHFEERAMAFREIRETLEPYGITCGWWNWVSMKSGPTPEFSRMVKADGSETPMASCPLDPAFIERFCRTNALFAKIAKPAFIFLEDDFSVNAAAGPYGCFCERHLQAFAKKQGRYYSREELVAIFREKTPESFALLRAWRENTKESLVHFAEAMRAAIDVDSPEIPIGHMQPGSDDKEGFGTQEICRALAGPSHTPFSRIYGTYYCGAELRTLPSVLHHAIYSRQHITGDFRFYHESDSYPHTRFFAAGASMRAILGAVYSYGFEGSTFQVQQIQDVPNEENAYAVMLAGERARFNEVFRTVSKCRQTGVELCYDPFWNTIDGNRMAGTPQWAQCVGLLGIPYTTCESSVAFWDLRQAQYADDAVIRRYLAKGLFLDGEAAKCLCQRGYGKYLGVDLGDDVADGMLVYDLDAKEIIREEFAEYGKGRNMPAAHMFAEGKNGKLLRMTVKDPNCQVLTELIDYRKNVISPAMTRFENELGGRVVVMGMTLHGNDSQALFNYRRQRLFWKLLSWCGGSCAYMKEAACVFTIMNETIEPQKSGFLGMVTLIDLGDDDYEKVTLHLPSAWREADTIRVLEQNGEWADVSWERTEDGVSIQKELKHLQPMYIRIG